jgi:uncharacterized OsmC-like protein
MFVLVMVIFSMLVSACSLPQTLTVARAEEEDGAVSVDIEAGDEDDDGDRDRDSPDDGDEERDEGEDKEEASSLATARAVSQLTNQPGRAIVAARGNHFVVDSVPPLNGPNEERNPLDLLLGALTTCGTFIFEGMAQDQEIPLNHLIVTAEADFDPRGLTDTSINPRIQAFRVYIDVDGPTAEQTEMLIEAYRARCPVYTTLSRSALIEVTTDEMGEGPVVEGLATARAVSQLTNQPGRAIVAARGNHFVVDSVPPLNGPNEERNPLDLLLGALGTCGVFIFEGVAREQSIVLNDVIVTTEADFDPRGLTDPSINPRIQAFHLAIAVDGPTAEEAETLSEAYQARCPVYTTLSRSAPIEIEMMAD